MNQFNVADPFSVQQIQNRRLMLRILS